MAKDEKIENGNTGGMTEAALFFFQQMQSEFDANTLKLGVKFLRYQPFVWIS